VIVPNTFLLESQTGRNTTFASRMRRAAAWTGSVGSTHSTSRFMISSQRIGSSLRGRESLPPRPVPPDVGRFNTRAYGLVRSDKLAGPEWTAHGSVLHVRPAGRAAARRLPGPLVQPPGIRMTHRGPPWNGAPHEWRDAS